DEIRQLPEAGISSIKVFLSNPAFDRHLDTYLEAVRLAGAKGMVSMLHCEDAATLGYALRRLVEQQETSVRFFPESRPIVAEVVATQRAVAIAELTGSPVYIVHLSSERALEVCAEARARGVPVFVETRPLYLHLSSEVFEEPD